MRNVLPPANDESNVAVITVVITRVDTAIEARATARVAINRTNKHILKQTGQRSFESVGLVN